MATWDRAFHCHFTRDRVLYSCFTFRDCFTCTEGQIIWSGIRFWLLRWPHVCWEWHLAILTIKLRASQLPCAKFNCNNHWKSGGAQPPHFQKWGSNRPPCPPFSYPSEKSLLLVEMAHLHIPRLRTCFNYTLQQDRVCMQYNGEQGSSNPRSASLLVQRRSGTKWLCGIIQQCCTMLSSKPTARCTLGRKQRSQSRVKDSHDVVSKSSHSCVLELH